jgi:hypothetical protein
MRALAAILLALACAGCPGDAPLRRIDGGGAGGGGGGGGTGGGGGGSGGAIDAPLVIFDAPGKVDGPLAIDAPGAIDAKGSLIDGPGKCASDAGDGLCINVNIMTCTGTIVHNLCPGGNNILCCIGGTPFSSGMPEPNTGLTEEPGTGGCPDGMLRIDDEATSHTYCVDRFEGALENLGDGTPWSPYYNPGSASMRARSLRGAVPQGYISGTQAAAACANAGKRLCTDDEWRRACRGPDNLIYPYGNTREVGVCNDHRDVHPAVELFGSVTMLDSPLINQLHDTVDPTGSRTGCVTAEGAYDMMGNLHEWTADPAGTFRGGFYVDTVINGNGCLYATPAHDMVYWDYSTGFRCCADP